MQLVYVDNADGGIHLITGKSFRLVLPAAWVQCALGALSDAAPAAASPGGWAPASDATPAASVQPAPAASAAPAPASPAPAPAPLGGIPPFTQAPGTRGPRFEKHIDQLLEIGGWSPTGTEKTQRYGESIPFELCREIVEDGDIGLLALVIGAGNWGVSGLPDDLDPNPFQCQEHLAKYFGGGRWKGRGKGSGKHVMDLTQGGLGIAHYDSGKLKKLYEVFPLPDAQCAASFKKLNFYPMQDLRKAGKDKPLENGRTVEENWQAWRTWGEKLLQDRDFQHRYMFKRWVTDFFDKALARNGNDVYKAIVWSRAASSTQRLCATGAAVPIQIAKYSSRSSRYQRQANFIMRVLALAAYVKGKRPGASPAAASAPATVFGAPSPAPASGPATVFGAPAPAPATAGGGYQPGYAAGSGAAHSNPPETVSGAPAATSPVASPAAPDPTPAAPADAGYQPGYAAGSASIPAPGAIAAVPADPETPPQTPAEEQDYSPLLEDFQLAGKVGADSGDPKDQEKLRKRLQELGYDSQRLEVAGPAAKIVDGTAAIVARLEKVIGKIRGGACDEATVCEAFKCKPGSKKAKKYAGDSKALKKAIEKKLKRARGSLKTYREGGARVYATPFAKFVNECYAKKPRAAIAPASRLHRALLRSIVLGDSVGQGGANRPIDVQKVKERLWSQGLLSWGQLNSTWDGAAQSALVRFEKTAKVKRAKGLIQPLSESLRELNGGRATSHRDQGQPVQGATPHAFRVQHISQIRPQGCGSWEGAWTCGPTSALMIIRYFKPERVRGMSEYEAMMHLVGVGKADLGGSNNQTRNPRMIEWAGLRHEKSPKELKKGSQELLDWMRGQLQKGALLLSWKAGHFYVTAGVDQDGRFLILDPGSNRHAKGIQRLKPKDMLRRITRTPQLAVFP